MRVALVALLPFLVTVVTFMAWTRLFFSQPDLTIQPPEPPTDRETIRCAPSEPSDPYRVGSSNHPGVVVQGYPSRGGLYILFDCLGVELEFLGIDRLNPSEERADSQADEDAHCDRMRQLGATWWKHGYGEQLLWREVQGPKDSDEYLRVGWPAGGGVWVLRTTFEEAAYKGAGLIHNAYTMEERCKVIERMGGVFYADPKDCPYLDLP